MMLYAIVYTVLGKARLSCYFSIGFWQMMFVPIRPAVFY